MKILKNLKSWKTTTTGIILLAVALYVVTQGITTDVSIITLLIGSGLALLFVPDTFINSLKKKYKNEDNTQ